MTTENKGPSWLAQEMLETAQAMWEAWILDDTAYAKITMRHLGVNAGIEQLSGDDMRAIRAKRISTTYPGVFYKERERKGKKDKYFVICYPVHGKQMEEGVGWESQNWNAKKASLVLAELRKNQAIGEGPCTFRDKRKEAKDRQEAEKARLVQETKAKGTFTAYFLLALANKQLANPKRVRSLFNNWIAPEIGELTFAQLQGSHLEKIKKSMTDAGLSPRTVADAGEIISGIMLCSCFM